MRGVRLRLADYLGKRFGTRVVIGEVPPKRRMTTWRVRCDCGSEQEVQATILVRGRSVTCLKCTAQSQRGANSANWRGFGNVPSTAYCFFKASAEHRGIKWSITIKDVDRVYVAQGGKCALSGEPLRFRTGWQYKRFANASLDRIDNDKGYTPDNIQLVTSDINFAKQQLSVAEFIAMCRRVVEHTAAPKQMAA